MTRTPGHPAKIRFRDGASPPWIRVDWPGSRATARILVLFADNQADALPTELCVDPGLLVITASCVRAAEAIGVAEWSADHAADLGAAPDLLFVAGMGVFGRLAAGVALHARDRRWPVIAGQVLVDPSLEPAPGDAGPYAAPLRARSVVGVASATVVTTARADGRTYVDRLR